MRKLLALLLCAGELLLFAGPDGLRRFLEKILFEKI